MQDLRPVGSAGSLDPRLMAEAHRRHALTHPQPSVTGSPIRVVNPTEYVPGLGGMASPAGLMPGGAVSYSMFEQTPKGGSNTKDPLARPHMLQLRKECEDWLNSYLSRPEVRGEPLRPGEPIPELLLLIMALKKDEPLKHQCLEGLQHLTFPLSTSSPVKARWGGVETMAVPYAVQRFSIGHARVILHLAQTTIFDDINMLWDSHRRQQRMRLLQPSERIVVSFHRWRAPTEEEERILNNDFSLLTKGTMLDMGAVQANGSLLLSFAPEDTRDEIARRMGITQAPASSPAQRGGTSAPVSQDPYRPPIVEPAAGMASIPPVVPQV